MGARILERDDVLAALEQARLDAERGHGSTALVFGEAGIGKTSVVDTLRAGLPADTRFLIGRCDDLTAARVLGPFRDLIGSIGADAAEALRDGTDQDHTLSALRTELDRSDHPTILVIEDAQWADDATLDVLRYLTRRVARMHLVVLLTYREDQLSGKHPLRQLLGIGGGQVHRFALRPLSPAGVRTLSAGSSIDADELFAVTSGNPFFVTEVLASGTHAGVPATVVDATLARLARIDTMTRRAVEQLSVVPTAIDCQLVDALLPEGWGALIAAEECGLLDVTPDEVTFRHELTRRAIADALPGMRRAQLNSRVLAALADDPTADLTRIMHHATQAGDRAAILRFGPAAARAAASSGAHREAAIHFTSVLEYSELLTLDERADLLEAYAVESRAIGQSDLGVVAQQEAIELRRSLGDDAAVGAGLRWLSRAYWWSGHRREAEVAAEEAVSVAERIGDPRLLATALTQQAALEVMDFRASRAAPVAERAIELARAAGDDGTLSYALNNLALARWFLGGDGRELMAESLAVAMAAGDDDATSRAYNNMVSELHSRFRLDEADPYVDAAIAFAERTDQLVALDLMHAQRAYIQLGRADWDGALSTLAHITNPVPVVRVTERTIVGRVLARRGDPDAAATLTEAVRLATEMGDLQTLGLAVNAAAEAAWLRGDALGAVALGADLYDELSALDSPCLTPELAYWMRKAGHSLAVRPSDEPYGLLLAGRWQEAADFWRAAGCTYEHALALTESSNPAAVFAGLEELELLGAKPLAQITRRKLHHWSAPGKI
ncbi:ATP-binding protein [Kribbella sp. NPDC004536]|uniref:ATP-binding protein n=1 Tax=Kribbella sp. NPDC004536 TaxID=3364106 RepID=UPI003690B114